MINCKVYTHVPEYSDKNSGHTAVEHENGNYTLITIPTEITYVITHFKEIDQLTISEQ